MKKDNNDDKNGLKNITGTHLFYTYEIQQLKVKKDLRHFKLSLKGKENGKIRRIQQTGLEITQTPPGKSKK